jgi:DNA-binding NarL/FixJ family response regulator
LAISSIGVLVVDDYEPWRRWVCSTLQKRPELQVIGEVSDGLEALQKATELQPDLILLDIGLPTLNGIEAARRIRRHAPSARILFLTENWSQEVAQEALSTGALGYVVKSDAVSDLLPAVGAVLQGKQFVSASLAGHNLTQPPDPQTEYHPHRDNDVIAFIPPQNHEVGFYSDDRWFLDHVTQFLAAALKDGNAAIVTATESHQDGLIRGLQEHGLDIAGAIEQGRFVALDAANALSIFMVNGMPDPVLFMNAFGDLILTAAKAAKRERPRVAIFGEYVHLLWAEGNSGAAIRVEELSNQLTKTYDVDMLCGYSVSSVEGVAMDAHLFQRICAEHSAVHSR